MLEFEYFSPSIDFNFDSNIDKMNFVWILEEIQKTMCEMPISLGSWATLIQYFYEGLMSMDRQMMDATNGGALVDNTSAATR